MPVALVIALTATVTLSLTIGGVILWLWLARRWDGADERKSHASELDGIRKQLIAARRDVRHFQNKAVRLCGCIRVARDWIHDLPNRYGIPDRWPVIEALNDALGIKPVPKPHQSDDSFEEEFRALGVALRDSAAQQIPESTT